MRGTNPVSASGQLKLHGGQTNFAMAPFPLKLGSRNLNAFLELMLDSSGEFFGSLIEAGNSRFVASLQGGRVLNTNLGLFNLVVSTVTTNPPPGFGYGSATLSATGAKVNLTLSDDKAIVTSLATDRLMDGRIPVFAPLYGNKGFLSGWIVQDNQLMTSSSISWSKAPGASTTYFRSGFGQTVEIFGGSYVPVTNLASWGTSPLWVDNEAVLNSSVDFSHGTYSKAKGTLSISINDGHPNHQPAPWVITSATGAVKFYQDDGVVYGNGILVPGTSLYPGVYGFSAKTVSGTGAVHSISSEP